MTTHPRRKRTFGGKPRRWLLRLVLPAIASMGQCACKPAPTPTPRPALDLSRASAPLAPRATDVPEDTRESSASWQFEYVFTSWEFQYTQQVLVVTTNPRLGPQDLPEAWRHFHPSGSWKHWGEVYLVSDRVAEEIDRLAAERGFEKWPSIAERQASDSNDWIVAVTRQGRLRHTVRVTDFFSYSPPGSVPPDLFMRPRPLIAAADDTEAVALTKNVFNLVDDVRATAKARGTLLDIRAKIRHRSQDD